MLLNVKNVKRKGEAVQDDLRSVVRTMSAESSRRAKQIPLEATEHIRRTESCLGLDGKDELGAADSPVKKQSIGTLRIWPENTARYVERGTGD